MSPARIVVRAVVITDGRSPHLAASLEAVLAQDPAPDVVHLALTHDLEPPAAGWDDRLDVTRVEADDYGSAVAEVLAHSEGDPAELLWLLHDDTAPMAGALAALTAIARKRRLAGVIGAAQVQWDSPDRLVGLGTTTSRVGARRIQLVEHDDVDQGQYATRDDVLAVSLGGALVRRELWTVLGGISTAADGWGASLDFCRRAWRAGFDVVAVPGARVRHSQEKLYGRRGGQGGGRRSTYGARRAAEWFHAMAYSPWWAPPLLWLWALLGSLARAVLRIAQNEPRLLAADLMVPWLLLALVPRLPRARAQVKRAGRTTTAERQLLAGPREVARHVRAVEWGERSRRAAIAAPSDMVRAELAVRATRRRLALTAVAIALTAASVSLHPSWLPAVLRGEMLAGATLGVTDTSVGDLWDRALTGWSDQAFGAPSIDGGLATLLLPFAAIPGGLALWLGLFLLLSPVLAGLTAWAATGAFTRSLWMRALAPSAYALWPIALEQAAQGRVAAVIVHVAAPLALLGLARAGGWQRGEALADGDEHPAIRPPSRSAAMGAAAALAVMTMAAPVLVALVVVVLVPLGFMAGRARWRVWGAAVPSLVAAGAGLVAAVRVGGSGAQAWAVLAREPGPSAQAPALPAADLLLGGIGETGDVPAVFVALLRALPAIIVLGAVLAAAVGGRRLLSAGALMVAAVAVVLGVQVQGVTLSPDGGAGGAAGNGWYGPAMTVAVLALLVVELAAWRPRARGSAGAARRIAGAAAVAVCLAATVGTAAAQAWPGRSELGDVAPQDQEVLPLVAALEQRSAQRQRVLVIDVRDGEALYSVLATDGAEVVSTAGTLDADGGAVVRPQQETAVAGPGVLSETVATLIAGGDADTAQLEAWGIGVVVAAPGSAAAAEALSQNADLQLMGSAERGTSWRVGAAEGDQRVSRAWFVDAEGVRTAIPMGRTATQWEAPGPGTVVLAEAADEAWQATLDGAAVAAVADADGRQVFSVAQAGSLEVQYEDRWYRVWWWATLVTVGWALIAAVPVRSRRSREEDA